MNNPKRGFAARRTRGAGRYLARRFGNPFITKVGRDTLTKVGAGAKSALLPGRFDPGECRAGFAGRYDDGGAARFAARTLEAGITGDRLAALARNRRRSARAMFSAAFMFLAAGACLMLSASTFHHTLFGFSTSFSALAFMALGIRHDFSRWQIENRRFGGFREYLKGGGSRPSLNADGLPGK